MKLVAKINDCRQFSEDGFESITHLLEIKKTTTIEEILDWQKTKFPRDKEIQNGVKTNQIYITPIDLE